MALFLVLVGSVFPRNGSATLGFFLHPWLKPYLENPDPDPPKIIGSIIHTIVPYPFAAGDGAGTPRTPGVQRGTRWTRSTGLLPGCFMTVTVVYWRPAVLVGMKAAVRVYIVAVILAVAVFVNIVGVAIVGLIRVIISTDYFSRGRKWNYGMRNLKTEWV